jgi:signal transduction histidine kinase
VRRFWPSSLVGQMAGLTLIAIVLSHGLGLVIYGNERAQALRGVVKEEFVTRTGAIAQLLETTPPDLHREILHAAGTNYTRYWTTTDQSDDPVSWQESAWSHLDSPLSPRAPVNKRQASSGDGALAGSFRISTAAASPIDAIWEDLPVSDGSLGRAARIMHLDRVNGLGLQAHLENGAWLNAFLVKPISSPWSAQYYASIGIMALALSFVAVVMARRIARPMQQLAQAAERLGRGEDIEPVPECGPADVRHTAEAFNRMRARLRSFIEDRTLMLAAIGHDLRTPITALRLHAEFVSDVQTRDKMFATLEEMQAMTEATLAFTREETSGEPTRTVDLAALLQSLCDDLVDLGWNVTIVGSDRTLYRCRAAALRRAVSNLIENAIRYGERARASLTRSGDWLEISVEDDGPGIPEADFERVFAPFVRLEDSRNRATGGVGLGLSIARNIIRGHGGDILLANRPSGGLHATIRLPSI